MQVPNFLTSSKHKSKNLIDKKKKDINLPEICLLLRFLNEELRPSELLVHYLLVH